MSTYAWFDISTVNDVGILDAKINDVLIRCLYPSQKFIFGTSGNNSSFIIYTNGEAVLKSQLTTPVIVTNHIIPINNFVKIADNVFIQNGTVTCDLLVAENIIGSNITIAEDGYIDGCAFIKASDYVETNCIFTNIITLNNSNLENLVITNTDLKIDQNLSVVENIFCNTLDVSLTIKSNSINVDTTISGSDLFIKTITNTQSDELYIQGARIVSSNIYAKTIYNDVSLTKIQESSNITTSNIQTKYASTSKIVAYQGSNTIEIQGIKVIDSNLYCSNISIAHDLDVKRNVLVGSSVYINSNLDIYGNATCSHVFVCDEIKVVTKAETPVLISPLIQSYDSNIIFNNGGVRIVQNSNLYASNVYFENTNSCNIETVKIHTNDMRVSNNVDVVNNLSVNNSITTNSIFTRYVTMSNINNSLIVFENSNTFCNGLFSSSNLRIRDSITVNEGCDFKVFTSTHMYANLFAYSNIKCFQQLDVNSIQTGTIVSPNNSIYIDNMHIKDTNHMYIDNVSINNLDVASEATIGKAYIDTSIIVSNNVECKNNVYANNLRGYTTDGSIKIENVSITDYNTMALKTLNASNINITKGAITLYDNTSIVKYGGNVIIDNNGKIDGVNITRNTLTSDALKDESVLSSKIATNAILSSHLSSGLSFKGVCAFVDINLSGTFNTISNSLTICGVGFSNSFIGLGGITPATVKYPLHVKGKSFLEDTNITVFTGSSNNSGIISLTSTNIDTPLLMKMQLENICTSYFQLATYPSSFGRPSVEQGDLIIDTMKNTGSISKIYLNKSCVISSSNIGIWKEEPLAPLHTTICAADKIGIGGIVSPIDTLHMIGNIIVKRDTNNPECYINILDNDDTNVITLLYERHNNHNFVVKNNIGEVNISAFDNDPLSCNHIRIQRISGHIGIGTSSPISPLHVYGYTRPGAVPASNTLYMEAVSPSMKFSNGKNSCVHRLSSNGQYIFEHISNSPYIKIINTSRVFTKNCNLIIGAADGVIELGPFTKLTMFTGLDQTGIHEVLINDTEFPVNVSISGPQRVVNWAISINSISITSTTAIINSISSDVNYKNYYTNSPIFTIDNNLNLIGIGTNNPKAAVDIKSSFTSNVISYNGKCILDTSFNLRNISGIYARGPFVLNGVQIFDDYNNLMGVNNINFASSLLKNDTVIVDQNYNLLNINTFNAAGPISISNTEIIDTERNLTNVSAIYMSDSIFIGGTNHEFVNSNIDVTCSNLHVAGDNAYMRYIELGTIGNIYDNTTDMRIETDVLYIDTTTAVRFGDVLEINIVDKQLEFIGNLVHNDKIVLSSDMSLSNIKDVSVQGPIYVNERTVLTKDFSFDVDRINFDSVLTKGSVLLIDDNRNLVNISEMHCLSPIYIGESVLVDELFNINLNNIVMTGVLHLRDVVLSCDVSKHLNIQCDNLVIGNTIEVDNIKNVTNINGDCITNVLRTNNIVSDSELLLQSSSELILQSSFVKTNNYFASPKYIFTDTLFNIQNNNQSSLLINGPDVSVPNTSSPIIEFTSSHTRITNDVIIGNPSESSYKLSVGGAIYADNDIISFSDCRKKSDIRVINNALGRLNKIKGVTFTRANSDTSRRYTGVLAQDVLNALPEAVYIDDKSGYMAVAYGNMIGLLIQSIKELRRKTYRVKLQKRRKKSIV